jgi:hypothetical protein
VWSSCARKCLRSSGCCRCGISRIEGTSHRCISAWGLSYSAWPLSTTRHLNLPGGSYVLGGGRSLAESATPLCLRKWP